MPQNLQIPKKVTALLVYSRPPLVFGGMLCAIGVMWKESPILYSIGVILLFISMTFDLADGWFSARFNPHPVLANLAERIMDKTVYSIIFPLVAVGAMWRLIYVEPELTHAELLHAIFILVLCVTVLMRDNFAHFMRGFALRKGQELESAELARIRTIVAAPVGALLYAHAFYIPGGPSSGIHGITSWLGNIPLRTLFFVEIIFLIINFGSIAGYSRKYGASFLDELCFGDEPLRRRILSVFPNSLTIMNAVMGLLAVFFAYQGRVREAYLFLIGAAMFDKLDGAMARKLGLTDPLPDQLISSRVNLGSILDDIADAVSFCIVPAWIFYITLSGHPNAVLQSLPVGLVALLYALFGILRLIYFTLDRNPIPGFFKGMPSPAAALLVVSPLILFSQALQESPEWAGFWGVFSFVLMIFAAVMMNVYPIHYLHIGRFMTRHPWFGRSILLTLVIVVFTPYFGHAALLFLSAYLISPFLTSRVDPETAARETRK